MSMLKKRILLSLGAFLFVFVFLVWMDYIPEPEIRFLIRYEKEDSCQVFEGEEQADFRAERSLTRRVPADKEAEIRYPWAQVLVQARIDFGDINQNVLLSEVILTAWGIKSPVFSEQILFINDLEIISYEEGIYWIRTTGPDPYLIFSTKEAFSFYASQIRFLILGVEFLLSALVSIAVFFQYGRSKILIFWALDILRNTSLIVELAFSDFKTRYASSYLGIIWAFIQPVVTITIYVIVFGYGFKTTPVKDFPFVLWLSSGIIPWLFFSEALMSSTTSLKEYSYLVKKVVFEVKILPLVKITAAFYIHLAFIGIVMVLYMVNHYVPTVYYLQLIYYALCTCMLSLGIAYITSALNVFVPDLVQIINIMLQFGMWMTPIMWSPDLFGPKVERLLQVNPMFYIVEGYRDSFYNRIPFWEKPGLTIYFWCITLIFLIAGMYTFRKLEKHFADVL